MSHRQRQPMSDPTPEAPHPADMAAAAGEEGESPPWLSQAEEAERKSGDEPAEAGPGGGEPGDEAADEVVTGEVGEGAAPVDAGGEEPAETDQDLAAERDDWRRKAEENREKWLRSMAELENFRKRSRREIESSINFANANLLRDLLDVLDNFERAHAAVDGDEEGGGEAFQEGIRLIYQRLVEVLRTNGLARIPARGEVFDPNLHEAVSQIETDEVESGRIAHVVQEGYRLKEMVLRPAKVVVAK